MSIIDSHASIGFTIRSLSNLLRRKVMEAAPPPPDGREGPTETGGLIMGYICDHAGEDVFQRDVEKVFCIRRSTASHFLAALERDGMLLRKSVPQDARLKRLIPTELALADHQEIERRAQEVEVLMRTGLSEEDVAQFLATARIIQQNLQ